MKANSGVLQANHHSFTGSEEDPEDGPAVAGSIFTAVIVYAVRRPIPFALRSMIHPRLPRIHHRTMLCIGKQPRTNKTNRASIAHTGLLCVLWFPGISARTGQQERHYIVELKCEYNIMMIMGCYILDQTDAIWGTWVIFSYRRKPRWSRSRDYHLLLSTQYRLV
jgi:hypothetical protein